MLIFAAAGAACARRLPDPVPVADSAQLEQRLQSTGTPDRPKLVQFEWRYSGRDGRFSGDGGVRVNPPDSVRLDLFGPGWTGAQSAILVGGVVHYIGEQRVHLPPPTFMWAMLGTFRPPAGIAPQGASRGDHWQLSYELSDRSAVRFLFDESGRIVEAELLSDGDVVQTIQVEPGEAGEDAGGYRWPKEARYRDLAEFHEVRIKVTETREHAPFESRIFQVAAR